MSNKEVSPNLKAPGFYRKDVFKSQPVLAASIADRHKFYESYDDRYREKRLTFYGIALRMSLALDHLLAISADEIHAYHSCIIIDHPSYELISLQVKEYVDNTPHWHLVSLVIEKDQDCIKMITKLLQSKSPHTILSFTD